MLTERQTEIINASLAIISTRGIQGFTIKNLSKMIGISEPAIYRHYENKIEILISLIDFFAYNTENIFSQVSNSDLGALDKINAIFEKHFEVFAENPSIVSVIFSEEIFINENILKEKVAGLMTRNEISLVKIIEHGQNKGELRNDIEAKILGILIMGTLRLMIKKWQFSNSSFDIKTEGRNIINSLKTILMK